jgi:peroxiredoxin
MAIGVGQTAPDFTLKNQDGDALTLAHFRGKQAVALVFYPFTFTGVCEGELCSLRDDYREFTDANVAVLAISCDTRFAQQQWAEQQGYQFSVLSDFWPHGEVARAYDVFNETLGCANRGTFVISTDGVIVDAFESPDLGTARDKSRYAEALEKL